MKIYFQLSNVVQEDKVFNKKKLIPIKSLENKIIQAWKSKTEIYHSASILNGVNEDLAFIFLDIDNKDDLNESLKSTRALYSYLENIFGNENLNIYFSGGKGFHLYLKFLKRDDAEKNFFEQDQGVRKFVEYLNNHVLAGLTPIDVKAIGKKRVIRCINSYHSSGRYKISLSQEQLRLNIFEILSLSKQPNIKQIDDNILGVPKNDSPKNNELYSNLIESLDIHNVEVKKSKTKLVLTKTSVPQSQLSSSFNNFYSTKGIVDNCRAIRNLVFNVTTNQEPPKGWRLFLSRSLVDSDNREKFASSVLSCHPKYRKDLTDIELLKTKSYGINCDELISSGFCKKPCERFLLQNGSTASSPNYFGAKENHKWFRNTSYKALEENLRGLIKYFSSTTDFFDWGNLENAQNHLKSFTQDITDKVRKGQIPDKPLLLFKVTKQNGKLRTLSMNHLETELFLSGFVKEMLRANEMSLLDEKNVHFHSYGYTKPGRGGDLIAPWIEEYNLYKEKIKFYTRSTDYSFVLTDDIQNFYPSFTLDKIEMVLDSYLSMDLREIQLIKQYFQRLTYLDSKDESITRFEGLPQGPLISHVIASRFLSIVDNEILKMMSGRDFSFVRYCDDLSVFFKNEEDMIFFKNVVTLEIEKIFSLILHKDYEGEDKSFCGTLDKYKNDKLLRDLAKYDLGLQLDLAVFDEVSREKLLSSVKEIFGSALNILNVDITSNLKDFERQISALSWKLPAILKNEEKKDQVEELLLILLEILSNEKASWRLVNSSLVIYLGFVKYSDERFDIGKIVDLLKSNSNLSPALCMHLTRSLFISDNDNLRRFGEEIVSRLDKDILEIKYLRAFLRRNENQMIVKQEIWNFFQKPNSRMGFDVLLHDLKVNYDGNTLKEYLLDLDSRFSIAVEVLTAFVAEVVSELEQDKLKYLFDLSEIFRLDGLSNIVSLNLENQQTASSDHKIYGPKHVETFKNILSKELALDKNELVPVKAIKDGMIFLFREKVFISEYAHFRSLKSLTKLEKIFKRIKRMKIVDNLKIIKTASFNHLYLLSEIDSQEINSFIPYLKFKSSEVEALEFKFTEGCFSTKVPIHSVLVPASCLYYSPTQDKFKVLNPSILVNSTLDSSYELSNGLRVPVIRKKMGLPGLRLLEASLSAESLFSRRTSSRDDLVNHSYNLMSPESQFSSTYWAQDKNAYFHNSLASFRATLAKNHFPSSLIKSYRIAYDLFKMASKKKTSYVRHENDFRNNDYALFVEKLKQLTQGFPLMLEHLSNSNSEHHFEGVKLISYNQAVGINLYKNVKKFSQIDHKELDGAFKILGFSSVHYLDLAVNEIHSEYKIKGNDWQLKEFRDAFRKNKKFFIFPTLGNLEVYDELWGNVLNSDYKAAKTLETMKKTIFTKSKLDITHDDVCVINEQKYLTDMTSHFRNLNTEIKYNWLDFEDVRLKALNEAGNSIVSLFSLFFDKLLHCFATQEYNGKLYVVLTKLTSLDMENFIRLKDKKVYVTFGLSKFRTISSKRIYPDSLGSLLPRHFNKHEERRKFYVVLPLGILLLISFAIVVMTRLKFFILG